MIGRVSGVPGLGRPELRVELLKASLHQDSRVVFRYRGARQTGRVLELLARAAVVEFRVGSARRAEAVGYNSILRVIGP
jgi:hypothetical protein